jgi:hypothetical protein
MGLLDHRKQWRIAIRATDKQCFQAFSQAMSKKGLLKVYAARWHVGQDTVSINPEEPPWPALVATYEGRAGIVGVTSSGDSRAQHEEQAAIGSQITFAVNPQASGGRTECAMWLSHYKTIYLGLAIADARFFRSYMHTVEKQLRALDSSLTVSKN